MIMQNEFSNGITVDVGYFRMLWEHSNAVYRKNFGACIARMTYVMLTHDWEKGTLQRECDYSGQYWYGWVA